MKNLNYFPYERNRYFYGKLLSVDDFESEQKYMNDKRRLINRFMHGCGVVCGLGVVPVGDDTISLEAGLALDFTGREILVEKPVLKKISTIDGFSANTPERDGCQYLCIEYSEYEKDPVYHVADPDPDGESVCHNKTAEGYHIYLTGQEPAANTGALSYYEDATLVYQGNNIRISQVFPKYAKSGNEFDFRVIVENLGQKLPISFGYELSLEHLNKDRKRWIKLFFDEGQHETSVRYEIPVTVRALDVKDVEGSVSLRDGSFWLKAGEHVLEDGAHEGARSERYPVRADNTVRIITGSIREAVSQNYFSEAMQEILNGNYRQNIYLARINLIRAGDTVIIDEVAPMPFGQYIRSDILSSIREKTAEDELKSFKRRLKHISEQIIPETLTETGLQAETEHLRTAEGVVSIEFGVGGLTGQKFFSQPVAHGLGLGDILVFCRMACGEKDRYLCHGAYGIFEEESMVHGDLAIRADRSEGTFTVGLKLTRPTTAGRVNIHWTAVKTRQEEEETGQRELFIRPDMVYLSLREDYSFDAFFTGAADRRVVWSVREPGGGTIDENGIYSAPDAPGIYEIVARSAVWQDVTASAFVVVRDTQVTG